ncbi:MAG: GGDEF domain-containing protein [Lachnospiraceae bacterium]|nr:GGDEF domain-containing protein [Lachnospiraceae bacterium]
MKDNKRNNKNKENDPQQMLQLAMEAKANAFNLNCHVVLCGIVVLCAWLNRMGIFIVDQHTMNIAVILSAFSFSFPILVYIFHDWLVAPNKDTILNWAGFKYLIVISAFIGIATTSIVLTFHAVLLMVLPSIYAAQYAYKTNVFRWNLPATAVLVLLSVYGGYFFGLPDSNFFPGHIEGTPLALSERIAQCPPYRLLQLFEHFVVPRFLAIFMIDTVLSGIVKRNADIAMNHMETAGKTASEMLERSDEAVDLRQAVLENMSITEGHRSGRRPAEGFSVAGHMADDSSEDVVSIGHEGYILIPGEETEDGAAFAHEKVKNNDRKIRFLLTAAVAMRTGALLMAILSRSIEYRVFSILTAITAVSLISASRDTQGHYRDTASAYMAGSIAWAVMEGCRLAAMAVSARTGAEMGTMVRTIAEYVSFLPDCFFLAGLVFFSKREYNQLHFRRMMVHAFSITFMVFMVLQKIVTRNMYAKDNFSLERLLVMLYFVVIVFTIVMVITIFIQTRFRYHTHGANCSAVILTVFNFIELSRVYFMVTGQKPLSLVTESVGVLGLVIFAWAYTDPMIGMRERESEPVRPGDHVQERVIWTASIGALLISSILFVTGFFDARDMYMVLLAVLAYIIIFKSIQANVYSTELIEHQKKENLHLEQMVKEKTAALEMVNEHLKHISGTDELTGLYNRRFGKALLDELTKGKVPFAFLLMDLNHFKQVNDRYGHDVGDQVLKETGQRLSALGDGTIAVRIGGDEFLVVVQEKNEPIKDRARIIAEKICMAMDRPIKTEDGDLVVSVCIGVAVWPDDTFNRDELYKLADKAMYEIKHRFEGSAYRVIRKIRA